MEIEVFGTALWNVVNWFLPWSVRRMTGMVIWVVGCIVGPGVFIVLPLVRETSEFYTKGNVRKCEFLIMSH